MTFTRAVAINNWGPAKFVVDGTTVANGTHSTIAAALTSASSGDTIFIRPGTYTENLTLKAGVNLTAFTSDASLGQVVISGKMSYTGGGFLVISNIRLTNASDNIIAFSGTSAGTVEFVNCYFLSNSSQTAISYTNSGVNSRLILMNCSGDITGAATKFFASSGIDASSQLHIDLCSITNNSAGSGISTTASTITSGAVVINNSEFPIAITTSSTSALSAFSCDFSNAKMGGIGNQIVLTIGGSGTSQISYCKFASGSSACVSVGSNLTISDCVFDSTNTNPVTGAGTVTFNEMSFSNTGRGFNATTKTSRDVILGRWTSPTQPAFLAYLSSTQSNVTGDGTAYTIIFDTENFDQASNYNNATGVFTAPIAGNYFFNVSLQLHDVGAAHTGYIVTLSCSTLGTIYGYQGNAFTQSSSTDLITSCPFLLNLAASETVSCVVTVFSSTKTVDVTGGLGLTRFGGYLVC